MRVLYITHCTDMSGANNSMLQMIKELRDNFGVIPFVVYPKFQAPSSYNIGDAVKNEGIESCSIRLTCFQRKQTDLFHKVYFVLSSVIAIIHILLRLRNRKFDLVHSNSSVIDTGVYVAKLMGIPHIWHFREVASLSFNAKPLWGPKYQKWVYNLSDRIVAISENVKKEFEGMVPLSKTVVIQNGILPVEVLKYPDNNLGQYNICIVGRVEENKNQLEGVKAIELLSQEGYKNVVFHIVGNSSTPYGKLVKDYIDSHNLDEIVIMHGARYDINDFLCDMNIGLMLSRHEAFGRVTIEYMMHKLCVIASNTSANPEIIIDGENGLLYSIGDCNDLKEKIRMLLSDISGMKRMSERGYRDAMTKYTSVINSAKVYDLYKSLI